MRIQCPSFSLLSGTPKMSLTLKRESQKKENWKLSISFHNQFLIWEKVEGQTGNRPVVSPSWRLAGEVDHKGVEEGRFGVSES